MTLCVAWKYEDTVCLAADSRMTGECEAVADIGIKVLECPIRIISAFSRETGAYEVLHESAVGIAFSGSFTSGYLIKETIAEVLPKLQFIGGIERLTFDKIAATAFKLYEHAVEKINRTSTYGNDVELFLVGRCPATKELMAYKFFRNLETERLELTRCLTGCGFQYDAIGAGEDAIRPRIEGRLAQGNCQVHFMVLEEVRAMIIAREVACVGGAIQYGESKNGEPFKIFGVQDFRMAGRQLIPMTATRGVDLESLVGGHSPDDLFLTDTVITPFTRLIDEAIRNC